MVAARKAVEIRNLLFIRLPSRLYRLDCLLHGVVVVDEMAGGDITAGIVGIGIAKPGATVDVGPGTAATELTPRLPISIEPSGIPTRGMPPVVVGDVGVDEAAMLFEPEPHIADIPAVSITPEADMAPALCVIPEVIDMPEVAGIADVPCMAVLMAATPAELVVAGADVASDNPPPS
jgi:hypothetical protein